MKIGIDKIGFAMPEYYLDIRDLAIARGIEPDKFTKGLLQLEMSIPPVSQDIVTLGAQAAFEILDNDDLEKIDMIIVGTESGIDQSKASAVFIHGLLDIQPWLFPMLYNAQLNPHLKIEAYLLVRLLARISNGFRSILQSFLLP